MVSVSVFSQYRSVPVPWSSGLSAAIQLLYPDHVYGCQSLMFMLLSNMHFIPFPGPDEQNPSLPGPTPTCPWKVSRETAAGGGQSLPASEELGLAADTGSRQGASQTTTICLSTCPQDFTVLFEVWLSPRASPHTHT